MPPEDPRREPSCSHKSHTFERAHLQVWWKTDCQGTWFYEAPNAATGAVCSTKTPFIGCAGKDRTLHREKNRLENPNANNAHRSRLECPAWFLQEAWQTEHAGQHSSPQRAQSRHYDHQSPRQQLGLQAWRANPNALLVRRKNDSKVFTSALWKARVGFLTCQVQVWTGSRSRHRTRSSLALAS